MADYVYRGNIHDLHLPWPEPKRKKHVLLNPAKCGTRSGYVAHRRAGEDACQPCRDANQAYNLDYKERTAKRLIKKGWTDEKCGTIAGYSAHRRHAVPACERCQQANVEYCRDWRMRKDSA